MSKKTIFSILAFVGISVFSLSGTVSAAPEGSAAPGTMSKNLNDTVMRGYHAAQAETNIQQALSKLTPEQMQSLEKLTQDYINTTNPLYTELASNTASYNALLLNDNPSPTEAGKLAGAIVTTKQKIMAAENQYLSTVAQDYNIYMGVGMGRRGGMGYGNMSMGGGKDGMGKGGKKNAAPEATTMD